jgi:Tfp pilus assembly protein PilN
MLVRINLLPGKRKQAQEDIGQHAQLAALALLIIVVGICYWIHQGKAKEVLNAQRAQKATQTKIANVQKDLSAIGDLEGRQEAVTIRQLALTAITAERVGPRHVLDRLRVIMDRPRSPTIKELAGKLGWKKDWDANNVTLSKFEEDPREPERVIIEGEALSADDVAELWLRLQTSDLFAGVQLTYTREATPKHPDLKGMKIQSFQLVAYANFRYRNAHSEQMTLAIDQVDQICAASPPPSAPPSSPNRP